MLTNAYVMLMSVVMMFFGLLMLCGPVDIEILSLVVLQLKLNN